MKLGFLKGVFILSITNLLVGFGNYLFQALNARFLSLEDFGEFQALFALMSTATIGFHGFNNLVMQKTNLDSKESKKYVMGVKDLILKISVWVSLVMLVFMPIWLNVVGYKSWESIVLVVLNVFLLVNIVFPRAVLQAEKKFMGFFGSNLVEVVLKIVGVFVVFGLGYSYNGVFGWMAISIVVAYLVADFYKKRLIDSKEKLKVGFVEIIKENWQVLFGSVLVFLFFNVDVILVKMLFNEVELGQYSILSLLGKIIFFGLLGVSGAMLPFAKTEKSRTILLLGILLGILGGGIISLFFYLFPEFCLSLFGKSGVGIAKEWLFLSGMAFTSLSILSIISQYLWGKNQNWIFWPIAIGFIGFVLGVFLFQNSIISVILSMLVSTLFSSVLIIIYEIFRKNKKTV